MMPSTRNAASETLWESSAEPVTDLDVPADGVSETPEAPRRPRAARRVPKSDAVLEAAVERARLGVLEVAPEAQVGRHVSAVVDGERLVTHRFEAFVPGYGGWQWYSTVARVARSKDVTVCEVGLLPSSAALLAPEWLPWSERVRPEDTQTEDAQGEHTGAEPVQAESAHTEDVQPEDARTGDTRTDNAQTEDARTEADADPDDGGAAQAAGVDPDDEAGAEPDLGDVDMVHGDSSEGTPLDRDSSDVDPLHDDAGRPDAG